LATTKNSDSDLLKLVDEEALGASFGETPEGDAPDRSIEASVGGQVRMLRQQLGITATELASLAELSVSALSKIENGHISPSLATLRALARALNVPVGTLFSDFDERSDCSYVPAGQGMRIERRGTREGHEYRLLGHSVFGDLAVEPYLITLSEGARPYTGFRHPSVEYIYMLQGHVRYKHADRTYDLGPGDSLIFDSNSSHGPEALIETPCVYLSVIVFQRGGRK